MSVEENMSVVSRLNDEIWNEGRVEVADEIFVDNYIAHDPSHLDAQPRGAQGVKDFVAMFRAGFPDIHITIEDIFGAEDKVVWRLSWRATHTGEYMGMPPTGRQISVSVIGINRVVDGKIVESWGVVDYLGSMQQLGTIPMTLGAPSQP